MNDEARIAEYAAEEAALTAAYRDLKVEFTKAVSLYPGRIVRTPGFNQGQATVAEAVVGLCTPNDELRIVEGMLSLVQRCAEGNDPATRLPAQALLALMAHHHAEMHKAELAEMVIVDAR